jgi:hypothetical protein
MLNIKITPPTILQLYQAMSYFLILTFVAINKINLILIKNLKFL